MKKVVRIILVVLFWFALTGYLIFTVRHCNKELDAVTLKEVDIQILDYDRTSTLDPESIKRWINEWQESLAGTPVNRINTEELEEYLYGSGYIKNIRIYTALDGIMKVEITQRAPIVRFKLNNGFDFYISDDMWVLPVSTVKSEYVPLVTGELPLPFESGYTGPLNEPDKQEKKMLQNYLYLTKLVNFVRLMEEDTLWRSQIVQVYVVGKEDNDWKDPEIELIPRVGNHIVVFGSLDDAKDKLKKLDLFYRNVLTHEGWDKYGIINVKYRDQVVCTK